MKMVWSTTSYNNFVREITARGGVKAVVAKLGWNETAILEYINQTRIPHHSTRIALAVDLGLPVNSFE